MSQGQKERRKFQRKLTKEEEERNAAREEWLEGFVAIQRREVEKVLHFLENQGPVKVVYPLMQTLVQSKPVHFVKKEAPAPDPDGEPEQPPEAAEGQRILTPDDE